jgi:hypothetical protein
MMMTRTMLFLTPIMLTLGAAPSFAAAQHDVSWYLSNRDALQSELAACAADPGDLANTPDCENAHAAQHHIDISAL